jgi:hypothetical protein
LQIACRGRQSGIDDARLFNNLRQNSPFRGAGEF